MKRQTVSHKKLFLPHEIVTHTTKGGAAHEVEALEFLAQLAWHIPTTYESITRYLTTVGAHLGDDTYFASPPIELGSCLFGRSPRTSCFEKCARSSGECR